jgi:phosphate transport system substrate-binding protein
MKENPGMNVSVSGGGSGNGIKAIIDGQTDIANSSRFIKNNEVAMAVEKGTLSGPLCRGLRLHRPGGPPLQSGPGPEVSTS